MTLAPRQAVTITNEMLNAAASIGQILHQVQADCTTVLTR